MDYGEAIQVLERANEKFEFPVKWGIDLQSAHERYLAGTEAGGRFPLTRARVGELARGAERQPHIPVKQFAGRRVRPLKILEHHQYGSLLC
jgi:hypothetical protein